MTPDQAGQFIDFHHQRLSGLVIEAVTQKLLRLEPDSLKIILSLPEALIHPTTRRWFVRVALKMDAAKVIPIVVEALSHPDWRIFQVSADILTGLGMEAREPLLEKLHNCPCAVGRTNAISCLHRLADPFHYLQIADASLVPHIAEAAADPSPKVRATADEALSKSEARSAEAVIVRALDDPEPAVRRQAIRGCGRLGFGSGAEKLIGLLGSPDATVRADAASALDRIGDVRAAGAVRNLLNDADGYVRWTAATALIRLWEADNIPALGRAADDPEPMVAIAALEALARKAPDQAKDSLAQAAENPHWGIQDTGRHYLAALP